mgnify:CR=1 FL=1
MKNWVKYCFFGVGGVLLGYLLAFFINEIFSLAILIAFYGLLGVVFLLYKIETDQSEVLKNAKDALVAELNKTIGGHGEKIKQSLKQGTDSLIYAMRQYNDRAQGYHDRQSAFQGLIKYHIYAAAIRSLHQSQDAEKVVKFVRKELEILEKIEAGQGVYDLCGGRAHAQKQALDTLLSRIQNGALKPKISFFKCKDCSLELEACPRCSGKLERRFKK